MVDVLIPKMGMTMKDGTLVRWLRPSGTVVEVGDPVFELATEKLEAEVEAESAGFLHHGVEEGTTLDPGGVVGWILPEGVAPPAAAPQPAAAPSGAQSSDSSPPQSTAAVNRRPGERIVASPNARRVATALGVDLALVAGTGPGGRITSEDVEQAHAAGPPAARSAPVDDQGRIMVSPIARRLAEDRGIDLSLVVGTGPGGRIVKEDVQDFVPPTPGQSSGPSIPTTGPPAPAEPAAEFAPRPEQRIPLTGMRGVIAERMHASLAEMAQLTMTMEVRMDKAVKLRKKLRREWDPFERAVPTYTDLVVKAVALALREHPRLNATVTEEAIVVLDDVHIGVAVALDQGLVVPVVRHADREPVSTIARETSRLAAAAQDGTLTLDEMTGGTLSVTSLGMFDIDVFTPVINPPNVAIIGVGRIRDGVRWKTTKGRQRPVQTRQMTLSLTIDHRAVDGAPAAEFLRSVRTLLESPMALLG